MGILELAFLFVIIPRRMARLARERNRSALKWSLAAIGVWIGTEFVVGIVAGLSLLVFAASSGRTINPDKVSWIAYVPALIAALISAEIMIRHLTAKPPLSIGEPVSDLGVGQPSLD